MPFIRKFEGELVILVPALSKIIQLSRQDSFHIATNQSLNLSHRVSTRGLFSFIEGFKGLRGLKHSTYRFPCWSTIQPINKSTTQPIN